MFHYFIKKKASASVSPIRSVFSPCNSYRARSKISGSVKRAIASCSNLSMFENLLWQIYGVRLTLPKLFHLYEGLGLSMLSVSVDEGFNDSVDVLSVLDFQNPMNSRMRHMLGENVEAFLEMQAKLIA